MSRKTSEAVMNLGSSTAKFHCSTFPVVPKHAGGRDSGSDGSEAELEAELMVGAPDEGAEVESAVSPPAAMSTQPFLSITILFGFGFLHAT